MKRKGFLIAEALINCSPKSTGGQLSISACDFSEKQLINIPGNL